MEGRALAWVSVGCVAAGLGACSAEDVTAAHPPELASSAGNTNTGSSGSNPGVGSAAAAGNDSNSAGKPQTMAGSGPATGGVASVAGATGFGGAASAGAATGGAGGGGGGGNNPDNPGNYPAAPRAMKITRSEKISIGFSPASADPSANGSQHYGEFDPKKPLQSKLVIPLGGVNSEPWKMGWAVERGYHVLTVDSWNDYPKDPGYPEYLESWSGDDLSQTVTQNPANSVMARVKAGLKLLATQDPGSDWGYFLDAADEVRWNDVIVFGYSFGGQMGVAASKYIAADRIIITSAPNVPLDSPWLKQPSKTPPERCYFLGGNKDGEHKTHKDETALLGWPGEVINVTHVPPPYASNRLEVDDGHSSFCGRPFNDGMVDWDSICEFMFHTKK